MCNGLLVSKVVENWAVLFIIRDFSTSLTMALLTALFLFLARWHFVKRIMLLQRTNSEK